MSGKRRTSTLLVADDDPVVLKLVGYQFEQAGLYCDLFESGEALLEQVSDETQACLLDLNMPGAGGIECMKRIKKAHPSVEVIILTNVNQAADALEAVRSGAFDYLTKPFDPNTLARVVKKAMHLSRQQRENVDLRNSVSEPHATLDLLGSSPAMKQVKTLVERIAPSDNAVLLTGQSGTGKTLLARVLHAHSRRAERAFVSVSCPSLPGELLESEMFGHEKGAFSGAAQRRLGRAELAEGGTLFLDEIGEMTLALQTKLLTFLQDKTFYRLGGEKPLKSDTRIIAATNQDLSELVMQGRFREDLYFRLNVLPIEMPSLQQRLSDIPQLLKHFLARAAVADSGPVPEVAEDLVDYLVSYQWPGNIREFENAVIRAYTLRGSESLVTKEDFMLGSPSGGFSPAAHTAESGTSLAGKTLAEIEKMALLQTLESCGNNKSETARKLGIAEKSVYNKLRKHGL